METKLLDYYKDECIDLRVEPFGDTLFMHIIISKWNKSVLRTCYKLFAKLQNEAKAQGFANLGTITPNPKFAKLFGGVTLQRFEHDGKTFEVINYGN